MAARKSTTLDDPAPRAASRLDQPLVQRAINRALVKRSAVATEDVERIIEATYRVLSRTGGMDPRMREILAEAGLSTQAFYRHFASKDELLLVVLEDGRIRLATYLDHRMEKAEPGVPQLRAWIEGMFAQATDATAAARTRPFILNVHRLMEQYPDEQQRSIAMLVQQVQTTLNAAHAAGQLSHAPAKGDALAIYHLTVSPMENHIALGTKPSKAEVRSVVDFALRAIGAR
jgi:AcrR family transcriptional regulator